MDSTFIGLLQSQISSLQESESNAEWNLILLETIKLLMSNADLSEETMASYDKFGVRRLFAAYGEVGKKVCSFYDKEKPFLDPAALNGSIGKTITETSTQIASISAAFDELTGSETTLLSKEAELNALDEKYKSLQQKSAELHRIFDTVSDDVVSALHRDNERLEESIQNGKKKKAVVDEENQRLQKLFSEVEKANTAADMEQHKITTSIISIIEKHYDEIETIFVGSSKSLDEIKADIERYIAEFEVLDASVVEYAETRAFYESWLGENSTIIDTMRKYGLESVAQLSESIRNAKANAEYELKAYDTIIKKVVNAEETAREAIARKQNKII